MKMRESKNILRAWLVKIFYVLGASILVLVGLANASVQNQTPKVKVAKVHAEAAQQPIFKEYRGVRLSMTMEETRAKLGTAVLRTDELDIYVFSPNETAQIAYNPERKVSIISIDYTGGVDAPGPKAIVGEELLERPDGSLYKMVQYRAEGFYVSYNKSAGASPVVTVTLQLLAK